MGIKTMDLDLADFIKPRADKIAIVVTLLLLTTVLFQQQHCGAAGNSDYCLSKLGFPASVYGLYKEGDLVLGKDLNDLNKGFLLGLAANLLFYYALACMAVFAYGRYTGRGKLGEVM